MKDRIKEVIDNYDKLQKAENDDGEFVIIAENDEGGGYGECKECIGVNEKGILVWSYLSGCSCGGGNSNAYTTDITAKTFQLSDVYQVEDFYNRFKCKPRESSYKSY